jgi:serine protease Do
MNSETNHIASLLTVLALAGSAAFAQPAPPAPPAPPKPPKAAKITVQGTPSAFLGVGVAEIDSDRVKALHLKEEHGVEVKSVDDDSPAAKAGVKVNDVILEYNGQRVEGDEQFVRLVHETPVGRQVKLVIWRASSTRTLSATIGVRSVPGLFWSDEGIKHLHSRLREMELRMPDTPRPVMSWQSRTLGVESESLNAQLAEYFGVKEGVLVRTVMKGTAADKAGFRAGDVITKVGDQQVSTPRDVTNALRSAPPPKGYSITISRDRKEMTVNVTIEDKSSEDIHNRILVRVNL